MKLRSLHALGVGVNMPKTICRFSMCFSVFQSHFIIVLFQLNYAIFFWNYVCLICFLCYASHRFDLSFQQSQDVAYTSMLRSSFYDKSTDGNVHCNVFDYVFFCSDSYFLMMSILLITSYNFVFFSYWGDHYRSRSGKNVHGVFTIIFQVLSCVRWKLYIIFHLHR